MTPSLIISLLIILLILEVIYFKFANRFNIIDQPNHRSSHSVITIRGGGIIFLVGLLIYPLFFQLEYNWFLLGLVAIGLISFMDDVKPQSNKVRILIHLLSVALMFYQLDLFDLPLYWIILAFFFVIGSINAINFMDGINGITGLYSLVTLCTLLYIDVKSINFIDSNIIIMSILTVIVFCFFNFRTKAKCFAGDVGSVSIAFIILFFILKLIIKTEDFIYFLLLLVYGMDTFTTIVFRMIRREQLSQAHRSHFYQYLANEKKISHLLVSGIYALIQVFINVVAIGYFPNSNFTFFLLVISCTGIFIIIRFSSEGSAKLLGR